MARHALHYQLARQQATRSCAFVRIRVRSISIEQRSTRLEKPDSHESTQPVDAMATHMATPKPQETLRAIPCIGVDHHGSTGRLTISATNGFRLGLLPRPLEGGGTYWKFVNGGEDLGDQPLAGLHLRLLIHTALNGS